MTIYVGTCSRAYTGEAVVPCQPRMQARTWSQTESKGACARDGAGTSQFDGLFMWSRVACDSLESRDNGPNMKLTWLLRTVPEARRAGLGEAKLDDLFPGVTHHSLPSDEGIPVDNWKYVVGLFLTSKLRLQLILINGLHIELITCYRIFLFGQTVLRVNANIRRVVRLSHKSIFDFLTTHAGEDLRLGRI